jgi:hypothetical protein
MALNQGKIRTKNVTIMSDDDVSANDAVLFVQSNTIRFTVGQEDIFNVGKQGIEDLFVARSFTWYSFQAVSGLENNEEWFAGGLQIRDTSGNNLVGQDTVLWTNDQQVLYGEPLFSKLILGYGTDAQAITEDGAYVEPIYVGIPHAAGTAVEHRFLYLAEANFAARTPDEASISYSTAGTETSDPRTLTFTGLTTYNPESTGTAFLSWPPHS